MKKNREKQNKTSGLWGSIVLVLVLILTLIAAWIFIYNKENPVKIERCIRALNSGRGYEILVEDQNFITKSDDYTNLMQFLEGQYQIEYHTSYDDKAVFYRGKVKVIYSIKSIRFNFLIWERMKS